jgi:aryl-phospho-beta-D-glucosidase BglC (GH1 family)
MKHTSRTLPILALCLLPALLTAQTSSVPASRLAHLRHGINTSHWFAQVYDSNGYSKEHFDSWTTADDIALIQRMGFDHVRLSVNPQPMFRANQADQIPPEYLNYVDAAVKMILDHGLAVVLDIHPDSDFKQKLATDDAAVEQFADFWRALARHYASLDPEMIFFEIINEPEMRDRYRWYGIESKLATAIREGAPKHTIIATGAQWSDEDNLVFLEPLRDPNVIYNFHFYSPHIFTHQGANWGVNSWHFVKGLAYPSTRASAEKAAEAVPDAVNRLPVIRYGLDHWNAARIDAEIAQAAAWAKRWNVPLVCNEFGVYRADASPQDRNAWIRDTRTALEKYGIGWAMWDYSGSFGVAVKTNGKAAPDEATLGALGLRLSAGK